MDSKDFEADYKKEYEVLAYKYTTLLKKYLDLMREHVKLLEDDSKNLTELIILRDKYCKEDKENVEKDDSREI